MPQFTACYRPAGGAKADWRRWSGKRISFPVTPAPHAGASRLYAGPVIFQASCYVGIRDSTTLFDGADRYYFVRGTPSPAAWKRSARPITTGLRDEADLK